MGWGWRQYFGWLTVGLLSWVVVILVLRWFLVSVAELIGGS